jgi:hypothetical protein
MQIPNVECRSRLAKNVCSLVIVYTLAVNSPRKARAEDALDFKAMYYMEDGARMKVFSPTVALQHELSPALSIRVDGMYNAISGATPTGAPSRSPSSSVAPLQPSQPSSQTSSGPSTKSRPSSRPAPVQVAPRSGGGGGGEGGEDESESDDGGGDDKLSVMRSLARGQGFSKTVNGLSAATPAPKPPPPPAPAPKPSSGSSSRSSKPSGAPSTTQQAPASDKATVAPPQGPTTNSTPRVPTTTVSDTRYAGNIELIGKCGRHTPSVLFSYSTESDYESLGIAAKNSIDFNQKNTTLLLGCAYTHDLVKPSNGVAEGTKDTVDVMAGVTQVLGPQTVWTFNILLGRVNGFISDPYKVVELNGSLVPEKRPDAKDKSIAYTSLTHYFEGLRGSVEGSYRYYQDGFGISAHTLALAWYQKLGAHWVARPLLRYYSQSEADFYDVRFSGSPEFYSSDYRVSALNALGYGFKMIWMPTSRLSIDASFERYEQRGTDGMTPGDVYPSANMFIVGARIWL